MTVIPISEFKVRLSALLDTISKRHDEIIVTKNGKPAAVLMNAEEYESWKETLEIMSNPDFVQDIKKGIEDLKQGRFKSFKSTDELFDSFK